MATPNPPKPGDSSASYSKMSVGDVEAIGAHCQMPFCHQLDFLPFRCESCKGKFCLDHRTETAHQCSNAGAWAARQRAQLPSSSLPTKPRRTILTHEQQCSEPSCKTLINTPLVTGITCEKCRRSYCLKHRFGYEHDCDKLTPPGPRAAATEKATAAFEKFKAWGVAKKAAIPAPPSMPQSKAKQTSAAQLQSLSTLKRTAKGDDKVPVEKRVYVFVETASDSVTSKIPKGNFFYSAEWSVGRVLDLAAKSLHVENVNNRSESEEEKLRVFHVEGGRLLEFGEKLGQRVKNGQTIVLLRGVGPSMASTPEKTVGSG
ncbi:hypothetical protein BDY17DRAFT_293026 [Neohortaea acidophila]|uniref:AN1-type domain-containing protein n=1 Tax=Neohortaea acidophila TaxID=245834 RepID=A0A6A6Q0E2_9PEZI|nr:uncharacterized protein BDY17DRAFT_293026 [Neohortaea acidophila]KAF2485153.1 hypothetical protein BDY17DRAFT_293026 [Neohortaea acidophila]